MFWKYAKQLYWNRTLAWVFSCKLAPYFQNTFFTRTPLKGWIWHLDIHIWGPFMEMFSSLANFVRLSILQQKESFVHGHSYIWEEFLYNLLKSTSKLAWALGGFNTLFRSKCWFVNRKVKGSLLNPLSISDINLYLSTYFLLKLKMVL